MGSICRKRFIKQVEAKTKHAATAYAQPQRLNFCRICGKPSAGKKYCQTCQDFLSKKGEDKHDKH